MIKPYAGGDVPLGERRDQRRFALFAASGRS